MAHEQVKIESRALYYSGSVMAAGAVAALAWFWGQVVPLFGQRSIGSVAAVLTVVAVFVGFLLTYRPPRRLHSAFQKAREVLTAAALAFVYAAIGLMLTAVAFYLMQSAFEGVRLDHWISAVLAGLTAGAGGYAAYLSGARLTSVRLSTTLTAFLASGVLVSMISAPNPYWWQIHFSSLGAGNSASAMAFNLTLVIGGLAIVGLADLIASDFKRWQATRSELAGARVGSIRLSIAAIGALLACVGIFAYDTNLTLHNISATGMTILFYAILLGLPWLARGFPKAFYIFSYALFGASIVCNWLYLGVGYFNLTTAELLTAGLIFVWVVVFVRHIAAGLADIGAQRKTAQ